MIERLSVTKKYGTYADTFLMLGLAQLVEYALKATQQKSDIQLVDEGTRLCIQLKQAVNLETIAKLSYSDPFPPVQGKTTDISNIPQETQLFNIVEAKEKRKLYRDYIFQHQGKPPWNEDAPKPPHPSTQNGAVLVNLRHDRHHNALWLAGWQLKNHYGALLVSLFQVFGGETQSFTNCNLPKAASAVKIYLPTSVQGVNRTKADSNKFDQETADWLSLWLIAGGLFTFGVAEQIKLRERVYEWRVVVLEPHDIQLSKYRGVLDELRQYNPPSGGHGIARFDAELVLRFCQQLLNNHPAQGDAEPDEFAIWEPINHFVSGFTGAHFNSKGQSYGVKEIFTLGLPTWIRPQNAPAISEYQTVLQEHLAVINTLSVEEGHSELLAAYRDFITSSNLGRFFHFQVNYADYVIKRLADAKPPRLFSLTGLNLMVKNFYHHQNDQDWSLTEITQDPGFLRIAKAINSATVYAGKDEHGWERIYGLAQRLSSQSGSKKDFMIEIAAFLSSYENENLRIDEELVKKGQPRRIWTRKGDLDRLIDLIEKFGSSLVAHLLIAYGYAKGWGKAKEADNLQGADHESD